MTALDRIIEYTFTMFMMENEKGKGIVIDLLKKKHYTSRNYYHTEKIKELYNYFTQDPPYPIYFTVLPNKTFLTKEEFFTIYITRILRDMYLFDVDYENTHAEEQGHRYKLFMDDLNEVMEQHKMSMNDKGKCKSKKKAISATIKRLVWNTNIGEDIGKSKCLCCKSTDITQMSFNCGHIVAEANGGDTIVSNLKPICQNCNSSMGTKNMEEFMKSLI